VAAAKKDKRQAELAKFQKAWQDLGSPPGNGPEQALRVLIARNGTREGANKACDALWERYVGINEFRIAKMPELAEIIGDFVKNKPVKVAEYLRGFLREYFKVRNTLDFGDVRELTPDQTRKFLDGLEWLSSEISLAVFFQLLIEEAAADEEVEAEPGQDKPKRRTEREANLALDRIRFACAIAAYGTTPSKAKLAVAHKKLSDAFKFAPIPELPPKPEPVTMPQIVVPPNATSKVALKVVNQPRGAAAKKAAKKFAGRPAGRAAGKKVAAKPAAKKAAKKVATKKVAKKTAKKAAKKVAKKKAAKKTSASRTGGGARPRTTRTTRSPSATKKSSRR